MLIKINIFLNSISKKKRRKKKYPKITDFPG
jgi:hypothetical protein